MTDARDLADDAGREAHGYAALDVFEAAVALAASKCRDVPLPSEAAVARARSGVAAVGHGVGGMPTRRRRRASLFTEFGGGEHGYVPCVYCGQRLHHLDVGDAHAGRRAAAMRDNPRGYPRFAEHRIVDPRDGGGYQLANLLPACRACNAQGDAFDVFAAPRWADDALVASAAHPHEHPWDRAIDRLAADAAPKITAALTKGVHVRDLVRVAVRAQDVRAAVVARAKTIAALGPVIADLHRDAYLIGSDLAGQQLRPPALVAAGSKNEGNPDAAALIYNSEDKSGALRDLLDSQDASIDGMSKTMFDRMASTLADGIASGASEKQLVQSVTDVIKDPDRAAMIASTEASRAVNAAAINAYADAGLTQFRVMTNDPCDECEAIEEDSPYDIGDDQPPFHPNCQCWVEPEGDLPDPAEAVAEDQSLEDAPYADAASLNEEQKGWKLNRAEKSAIANYGEDSWMFQQVAMGERSEVSSYRWGDHDPLRSTRRLQDALERNVLKEPMTVRRDEKSAKLGRSWGKREFAVGKTFTARTFTSTTIREGGAESFADRIGFSRIEIRLPAGSQGGFIAKHVGSAHEMEYLLPAGSQFRVVSVEKESIRIYDYRSGRNRSVQRNHVILELVGHLGLPSELTEW